jgi:F-type H+-transporting ATPase subunit b
MRILRTIPFFSAALTMPFMASAARAEEAGLPQLDTAMFPEQLFWLAICFALLYMLMSRIAMPRVEQTLDNRRKVVEGDLAAARTAQYAAKLMTSQTEKSIVSARAQAQAAVNDMIAKVTAESAESQAMQDREQLRRLRDVEEEIAKARVAATKSVQASAADLAAAVTEKVLDYRTG